MDREYLTIWLQGRKIGKCVVLARKSTISSGNIQRVAHDFRGLIGSLCLVTALLASPSMFAQTVKYESTGHDFEKHQAKVKSKAAVVEPAPSSMPSAAAIKESQSDTKPVPAHSMGTRVVPVAENSAKKSAMAVSTAVKTNSTEMSKDKTVLVPGKSGTPEKASDPKPALAKSSSDKVNSKGDEKKLGKDKADAIGSKASGAAKTGTSDKEKHLAPTHFKGRPGTMLVPPPPPDTPTMLPGTGFGDDSNGLMPMEYMSPDLLKKRKQDLVAQLADAKSEAQKKVDEADSVKTKGVQFKTLFEEGVISKRELEAAQKEANEVDSSINRAQLRVSELQTLLDGVSGRIDQINKKATRVSTGKIVPLKRLHKKH